MLCIIQAFPPGMHSSCAGEEGTNLPRLLPIPPATAGMNFVGPLAVRCELGLYHEKKGSISRSP